MTCIPCARDFHDECDKEPCCCSEKPEQVSFVEYKGVRDVSISAGRKEAAVLYPINPSNDCEWMGLADVGGGLFPIVGCVSGKQVARHHGPDKTTTNNAPHNVHRICKSCHERWHAKNNGPYKVQPEAYLRIPHKPRVMSAQERVLRSGETQTPTGETQTEDED